MKKPLLRRLIGASLVLGVTSSSAGAQEPGWISTVVATGTLRKQLDTTPMVLRPYRPFHFYGNTVRRLHYRGRLLPSRMDVRQSLDALTTARQI